MIKKVLIPGFILIAALCWTQDREIFASHDIIDITVSYDIAAVEEDIKEERSLHQGKLSYMDSTGQEVQLNIQLRTRGKTRRNPMLCDSPPLTIHFNVNETSGTLFRGQDKLKLVVPCKKSRSLFEQYLLQEYLCYRVYNILSPLSFRVQLVRLNHLDTRGKYKSFNQSAFFIESIEQAAQRNNGIEEKSGRNYWFLEDKNEQIKMALFQFLIGNTDWSVAGRHNVKLIQVKPGNQIYALPYDFDMSGIVNARYAQPHEKIQNKITSVRSRLYRGMCRQQEEFSPVVAHFNQKKESIYALYENFPLLNSRSRKNSLRYIDEFYKIINDPSLAKRHLVENCKKL